MNLFNPFKSSKPAGPPPPAAAAAAPTPAAAKAAAAAASAPEPSPEARARLERLFRYCTREGAINPLMYVLTRYRAKEQ